MAERKAFLASLDCHNHARSFKFEDIPSGYTNFRIYDFVFVDIYIDMCTCAPFSLKQYTST